MDAHKATLELLREFKCKKLRRKKHFIYVLPSGLHYAMPSAASDHRAWDNCLSQLKVALGISRRGKTEKSTFPTKRKPTAKKEPATFANIAPAPRAFSLREKVRAALRGEKLSRVVEQAEPPPVLPVTPQTPQERFRSPRRFIERERNGAVRVWSRQDIEAANTAMRVGKLDDFMHHHYAASHPEAVPLTSQKEESTMLAVEQIDATIQELDAGMASAMQMASHEQAQIERLQVELMHAQARRQAAHDKNNSLNDVKTSLSVLRSDIEKVRPMLGLLSHKSPSPTVIQPRGTRLNIKEAVQQVLDRATTPMRTRQIWEAVIRIPGFESYKLPACGQFLCGDVKQNGKAVSTRVGGGLYWRAHRDLPEGWTDHLAV